VTSASGETPSGFELKFTLSNRSPLQTVFLLSAGSMPPILRVIIVATVNGMPNVLMDGVVLNCEIAPGSGSSDSILTIKGEDLTALMKYIDFSGIPYPAMPYFARVALIIAKYAAFGVIPLTIPEIVTDVPVPTERIERHQDKDFTYVQRLAHKAGYVFYIDPGPMPGMNTAYWGPEVKVGAPQPALNINMDAQTNVESLQFSFDKDKKSNPIVYLLDDKTKTVLNIPIPDITPLNPPLGAIPPLPPKFEPLADDRVFTSPMSAVMSGLAAASRTSDAVFANGTLDVLRYGRLLKSRQLVGVRGAGMAFDGLYYVKSVTHSLKRGEYKQNFQLARNGLVSTVPLVPS